ncbi:MAG: peptidoglycan DD-metalloendopeptidase family protein [Paludibacteraceae bacterium]|nr:peptidoglycan DD-metalloendopeptidase family protein [Paludibacteraceae bacterium]
MISSNNSDSFWKRLSYKYRLSIMNEDTLIEAWHIRLSRMSAFVILTLLFLLTLALFSVLIIFTPIRNVLPGYNESIRHQLINESVKMDSIGTSMELQRQYLNVIRDVVAGQASTDSVQTLDSLQIVMREQLLQAKSEVTADFIAQYEAKEKDNLQLFDVQQTIPVVMFFRPVHGIIIRSYNDKEKFYGVELQTPKNENVTAILPGSVVLVNYDIDNTYTIVLQHTHYVSVYRRVKAVTKGVGSEVEAGETIAIASDDKPLLFELWQDGKSINPEDVVVF